MPIAPGCINDGDSNGHGTHIAGIIGATTNNGAGVAGLNWNVGLLGYCVVSPTGIGSSLTIAQGVQQAIKDGADVINLSLGGPILPGMDRSVEEALHDAAAKNITIVAAAGNCGHLPPGQYPNDPECFWGGNADKYMPGADPQVINVAAIGPSNEHPKYSNTGSTISVAAPGGNPSAGSTSCLPDGSDCVYSTWDRFRKCPSGGVQQFCPLAGTSMAAPHVTGVAALLKSFNKSLPIGQIRNILNSTADDLGTNGKDPLFGYGRVDVAGALERVSTGGTPMPTITPTPSTAPNCVVQKQKGDYDCNGVVNLGDFETWRQDFTTSKATLIEFEWFRAGFSDTL
jgi:subtilisin family serine protease